MGLGVVQRLKICANGYACCLNLHYPSLVPTWTPTFLNKIYNVYETRLPCVGWPGSVVLPYFVVHLRLGAVQNVFNPGSMAQQD